MNCLNASEGYLGWIRVIRDFLKFYLQWMLRFAVFLVKNVHKWAIKIIKYYKLLNTKQCKTFFY